MEENFTESRTWVHKMKDALSLLSLEPIIFLQTFTWGLGSVIQQNLIIAKVCKDLGYSPEICDDINNHDAEDDAVQTRASQINMYMSILGSLPCMLVALFIGPWSDKNGRKPVMIIPMIGVAQYRVLSVLNCFIFRIHSVHTVLAAKYLLHGLASKLSSCQWGFQCLWWICCLLDWHVRLHGGHNLHEGEDNQDWDSGHFLVWWSSNWNISVSLCVQIWRILWNILHHPCHSDTGCVVHIRVHQGHQRTIF